MLFLQGTKDTLAELDLLQPRRRRPRRAAPRWSCSQDADHSFHVPARTGRKDAEVMAELLDAAAAWMAAHAKEAR